MLYLKGLDIRMFQVCLILHVKGIQKPLMLKHE